MDKVYGGSGRDTITVRSGTKAASGAGAADRTTDGAGNDGLHGENRLDGDEGVDRIHDDAPGCDQLSFAGLAWSDLTLVYLDEGTWIGLEGGSVLLEGAIRLGAADFDMV